MDWLIIFAILAVMSFFASYFASSGLRRSDDDDGSYVRYMFGVGNFEDDNNSGDGGDGD